MSNTAPLYCTSAQAVAGEVERAVTRHRLFQNVARLGLAVSGGADSVALLYLILPLAQRAGLDVTLLHFNHGLRAEARADERFVEALAQSQGLPFFSRAADRSATPRHAQSIEMAARSARIAFFREASAQLKLDALATGHQADDVAETLLLRLARGSGSTGLSGLRPRSRSGNTTLIRPLLAISARALRSWLEERGLPWREDASNLDVSIPRNTLRHRVIPALENMWASTLRARLCQSAEILREEDDLLERLAAARLGELAPSQEGAPDALDVAGLLEQPLALQRRILRQWLFRQGQADATGLDTVTSLLNACRTPKAWKTTLSEHTHVSVQRGQLLCCTAAARPTTPPVVLPSEGTASWGDIDISVEASRGVVRSASGLNRFPTSATLSAEALAGRTLHVRARLPGDRIAPTGLTGTKKIQDLFTDEKIPESLRDALPLVVCGDEIAWVPGYRVARSFAVPSPDAPCVRLTLRRRPQPK